MSEKIAIAGGGAAGFFAAIACARANPQKEISIFERTSQFLSKVRISGGGRCNVTHACFDSRELTANYPRGARALISPLHKFSCAETMAWFEEEGVRLKTEPDGRMFPTTDSSDTIVDCLVRAAQNAGVKLHARKSVDAARSLPGGGFDLTLSNQDHIPCDRLLLATGGARSTTGAAIAESLGHAILPPVPSLFSFHIANEWLRALPGISLADVDLTIGDSALRERGPMLITHQGLSGPAILRLSAWGARILSQRDYHFSLRINWLPEMNAEKISGLFATLRESHPKKRVANSPLAPLPARLWEQLVANAAISPEIIWTALPRANAVKLAKMLSDTELEVVGKSLNKDEFVTCGGVHLREIDFKTMESRITSNLYFAGELLDLDGITGGFNFQAAWTTGWIAGNAMADA